MRKMILTAGAVALAHSYPAMSLPLMEDLDALDELTAMVASTVGRQALAVDRRIKLPRCPEAIAVELTEREALAVRCESLGWRMRVPMSAAAGPDRIGRAVQGSVAPAIRRGDSVRLEIETETFSISYAAVAIDDATVGQSFRVRTADTKMPVRAVAVAAGRARLED